MKRFFTVGHSRHAPEKLIGLLRQHRITMVADARTYPSSRRFPQFNGRALRDSLEAEGITYYYCGRYLGGRQAPEPISYSAALDHLEALAEQYRIALLCAEEDPARCHRGTLLTPSLLERRHPVFHIRASGDLQQPAPITPAPQLQLF